MEFVEGLGGLRDLSVEFVKFGFVVMLAGAEIGMLVELFSRDVLTADSASHIYTPKRLYKKNPILHFEMGPFVYF